MKHTLFLFGLALVCMTCSAQNTNTGAKSTGIDFQCELGSTLTIYPHEGTSDTITLRWNKHLHRMDRVETSTGANRFENPKMGLVWITLPAKGMLLDSKRGRPLANECMNTMNTQKTN